jgi:hypothetical protein
MVRLRVGAVVCFILLSIPILAAAQDFPALFSGKRFHVGGVQCSVSAKAGYQQMAVNFSLPVPFSGLFGVALATTSTLDFKLEDGGMWIGGVEADLRRGPISAFLDMEGNAGKNARVLTTSEPFWAGEFPVDWAGSRLEWWAIDGGAGVDTAGFTVLGGLRVEKLSLQLLAPVDPTGIIRDYQATFGDHYTGDFSSKLWLPFVGVRYSGSNWHTTLRCSPFAWTDLIIPARYLWVANPSPSILFFEQARYRFKHGGLWLDGAFDYDIHTTTNWRCSLWTRASWLKIRGNGSEGYQLNESFQEVPQSLYADSSSATGMYTSYNWAVGLRCEYLF